MKHDEFGDRMKAYEAAFTDQRIPIDQYLCVRIDGKGFSKFTKHAVKPFDKNLSEVMVKTTLDLVNATGALVGYTQSDEITLVFGRTEKQSEHVFGGKVSKLNSVFASMAAAFFNHHLKPSEHPSFVNKGLAFFDCRAWGVPSKVEASNVVLWRCQDARKNSVSAMFRWTLGSKKMHGLDQKQMIATMADNNISWCELENKYKYGTFVRREVYALTSDIDNAVLELMGERDGNETVFRTRYVSETPGYFGDKSVKERVEFIFGEEE